jgi:hypothetical protein
MSDQRRWPDAALAGLGSSMRTFAAPAALSLHGRITGKPRIAVLVAASGELVMDKAERATDRTDAPAGWWSRPPACPIPSSRSARMCSR